MNQPEQPDMLEPQINDRGLAYMPIIAGTLTGTGVNVHESSLASLDCLWVEARGYHTNDGDGAAAQITIDDALIFAAQIYALAERRGWSSPASRATTTHPAGALTFGPDAAPKAGDIIRYSYDGDTYTARIRTVHEDGTIETEDVDLPLGHEFAPITGMLGNELDECGHRADGTELTRCGYRRADHEPDADEDGPAEDCPVPAGAAAALGDADDDPRYARSYTPRGYPYENMRSVPGSSNGPTPDGTGPRPLAVVLDEDITGIDNSLNRTRRDVAAMADRIEYLERCYREVPRPQDVGMLAAHLAKIERLEGELAERDRELKAHKDVLGQVGTEKRKIEEQLEAHHRHEAHTPAHRQVVLIEGLLAAVDRGVDPAAHPLDVPPGVAGRVADALVKARTDAIAEFVSRQSGEYRKHSAEAVKEDVKLAVAMGVPLERFYDPEDVEHVRADLDAEADEDRVDVAALTAALARLVAGIPEADEPDDIIDKVRAALEATTMRANGYKQTVRQVDVVLNKFAADEDPLAILPLELGSVPARVAEFLNRERHARLHDVGEPQHTIVDTGHYFGFGITTTDATEADTDE